MRTSWKSWKPSFRKCGHILGCSSNIWGVFSSWKFLQLLGIKAFSHVLRTFQRHCINLYIVRQSILQIKIFLDWTGNLIHRFQFSNIVPLLTILSEALITNSSWTDWNQVIEPRIELMRWWIDVYTLPSGMFLKHIHFPWNLTKPFAKGKSPFGDWWLNSLRKYYTSPPQEQTL